MRVIAEVRHSMTTRLALCAFLAAGGCVERDILHHDLSGDAEAGDAEELSDRSGNFPEPAQTVCGTLPPGVSPIPGLNAAWAVQSTFETWDSPEPYPGIRLRFSDYGFECADDFPSAKGVCESTWAFALTLPVDLAPGIYELGQVAGLARESKFTVSHLGECAGGEAGEEGGYEPSGALEGEIEIFAVTSDCIMGEVRNMAAHSVPPLEPNGGFVAQRCQSTCVPGVDHSC